MEKDSIYVPAEILKRASESGVAKVKRPVYKQIILAFAAGAFVAFGCQGSNMAAFNLLASPDTYGIGRLIAGLFFGTALMLVIIAGGELFTGNVLITISLMDKKVTTGAMLKNWFFVYLFNFAGAFFITAMVFYLGSLGSGDGLLGGVTIKIAFGKASISFFKAFISGIMCNWLVCLAVWMSYAARDISGKILSIFFVIALFVISGFEHCIANMYYIPAGILAKGNELWAAQSGLNAEQLGALNWQAFAVNNLLPVTLGNIIGGVLFVACFYWVVYKE